MDNLKKYIRILLVIGLIGFVGSSYQLYALKLWGYWSLLWMLSVWLVVYMTNFMLRYEKREQVRYFILTSLGGVFLALGFSPWPLAPFMFFGFVPILWVIYKLKERSSFFFVFNGLLLWNILATFWVANSTLVGGVIAVVANSLLMCVPLGLFKIIFKKGNATFSFLALVTFWVLWETLHLNWEISWPWLTLGNSFSSTPMLVQWYSYTGVMGGTLWILMVNWLIFKDLVRNYDYADMKFGPMIQIMLVIALPMMLSVYQYYHADLEGEQKEVVLIQPNYEPHYEKFNVGQGKQLERFLKLSKSMLSDSTAYLIFPETSFDNVEESRGLQNNKVVKDLLRFSKDYPQLTLECGLATYKILSPHEKHTRYTRKMTNRDVYYEYYNSTIEIEQKDSIELYHKGKMVPGTESFPYSPYLYFLGPIIKKIGGTSAGLGISKQRKAFRSRVQNTKIAPMICYESIYGDYGRGYIQQGAQFVAVETNDGWWDDTPGYKQHLNFARLRAIEYHRDVIRSANTGSSAFINARGDILNHTPYNKVMALRGNVTLHNDINFYVKYGDVIARMAYFFLLLILLKVAADFTRNKIDGV